MQQEKTYSKPCDVFYPSVSRLWRIVPKRENGSKMASKSFEGWYHSTIFWGEMSLISLAYCYEGNSTARKLLTQLEAQGVSKGLPVEQLEYRLDKFTVDAHLRATGTLIPQLQGAFARTMCLITHSCLCFAQSL
jgi:hypothetical protein